MKDKVWKKIISVILIIAIIINVIPNFSQLFTVYANNVSNEKNLIVKKGNYDEANKVIALEVYIRNINLVSFDFTFSYPSEILTPISHQIYELAPTLASNTSANATDIVSAIKINTEENIGLDTNNSSELNVAEGTIRTFIFEKDYKYVDSTNSTNPDTKMYTIYFRIEGDNSIDNITADMFPLIYDENVVDPSLKGFNMVEYGETENTAKYDTSIYGVEGFNNTEEKKVTSIAISGEGVTKEYKEGDTLDITNITVTKTYSSGNPLTEEKTLTEVLADTANYEVKLNETTFTTDTTLNVGDVLKVTYKGADKAETLTTPAEANLNVTKKQVTGIEIRNLASSYKQGTEVNLFDNIYIIYDGDTANAVQLTDSAKYSLTSTGNTITDGKITLTNPETTTVTVTYTGDDAQEGLEAKTYEITVVEKVVESIAITEPTTKLYKVGDTLNLSGLTVTATYDTGDTVELAESDYTIDVANNTELTNGDIGVKTITVKYNKNEAITATFDIVVFPNKLVGTEGQTLADVAVAEGFSWENESSVTVGANNYNLQFTNTAEGTIKTLAVEVLGIPTGLTATYGQTLADVTLPEGKGFSWADTTTSVGAVGEQSHDITYDGYTGLQAKVNVDKKAITLAIGNESSVYGESIKTLTVEDLVTLKEGSTLVDGDEISSLGITLSTVAGTEGNTNAGEYEITGTSTSTNYEITFENGTYTIEKADPVYTLPTGVTATYGDDLSSVVLPDGFTWEDTGKVGDAGTQTHRAKYTPADSNHKEKTEIEIEVEVAKADLTAADFSIEGMQDKTWDGVALNVIATPKSHIPKTETFRTEIQYYSSDDTEHALLSAPSDAKTYIVKLKVTEGTNYNAANIELGTVTITPEEFDASKINYTNTSEYDGTDKNADTVNITIDGDSEATVENVTFYQGGNPVNAKEVGTYTVKADITTSSAGTVEGYTVGTFTITPRKIKVTIGNATNVYGNLFADAIFEGDKYSITEGSIVATDELLFIFNSTEKNAGTHNSAITGAVSETCEVAKNYEIEYVNGNYTITPKAITVTIGNVSSEYTGEEPTMPATEDVITIEDGEVVEGDDLGITLEKGAGVNAGDYAITGTATNTNYEVTFINLDGIVGNGTYTITKAKLTAEDFERDIQDVTFGTEVTINPTYRSGITDADAGAITVKYYKKEDETETLVSGVPTEVGTYVVKVNTPGGTNYFAADGSDAEHAEITLGEFNITKETIEEGAITVKEAEYIYKGEKQEPELETTLADIDLTAITKKYYQGETEVAEPINAGTYTVKVTITGIDGYEDVTDMEVGTFEIKPREVTVTVADKTSVYGDALETLTSNVTSGSVIGTDDLGITLTKADGTDVGEYAITGTATNTNYNVTFVDGTYAITERPVTISIDNKESAIEDKLAELTYSVAAGNAIGTDKVVELSTNANNIAAGTYDITVSSRNNNYDVTISNTDEKGIYTVKDKVKEIKLSREEIAANCGTTLEALINGITYQVVYAGKGEQTPLALDKDMITTTYNPNTTGEQILTVSYTDTDSNSATNGQIFTTELKVTLSDTLESITVATTDKNVNYYEGQTFNKEDMVVTANYAVATSRAVDNYKVYVIREGAEVEITDATKLKTTDTKIIVKYTENGTTVASGEITIDVKEDEIVNITFNFSGEDTYNYGDAINLGTSKITKVWASGLTHENDTIPMTTDMLVNVEIKTAPSSFDAMKVLGDKQIGVQYTEDGKTIVAKNADTTNNTFTITVNDVVTGIQIQNKENLQKEYDLNNSLNYNYKDTTNPVKVTVTYASARTEEVNLSECTLTGFDLTDRTKIGATQTVTVAYEGQVDSFEVKVRDFVESIKVTKYKAIYDIGESLNIQEVKAIMASGTENPIKGYTTSGFDSTTPGTVKVTVTYAGKNDEITVTVRNKVADMYIEKLPSQISSDGTIVDKTIAYGTALSKNGGSIIVKDAVNPAGKEISMTDPSVSLEGYNPNKTGTQTVTVRYTYEEITDEGDKVTKSKTATFNVEVQDYVTGIKLTPPAKTTYEYGESLKLNGATVSKVWASGKTTDTTEVSGDMISGYNSKQVGAQTINVNAFGRDNVGSFTVTVVDSTLDIYMKKQPNKLTYTQGESLDVTGAVLNVIKSSGSKEMLLPNPSVTITGYNPNKVGTQIVTVIYDGKQTQFVVTVKEAPKKPTTPTKPTKPTKPTTPTKPTKPSNPTSPTKPSTSDVVKYTVTFVNYDGTVLKTEEVESGKSATAPELEKREGYKFKGWDKLFDEVKEDITVKAQYEEIERAKVKGSVTVEQGEDPDLSDVTLEIFDENGGQIDEIPVTEDMISGFNPDKIGTQIVTVTYVGEDGYEYTDTLKIRVVKPTATLGVKDETKDTEETNMPILPIVAGVGGGLGLLLILLALVTRKNVEIYALTEDKRILVGKQKISKNNTRIVLDEYEKQLENANIEIVLNKNITKKLDEEMISVILKGKKATYKVQYINKEEFIIRIKNAD